MPQFSVTRRLPFRPADLYAIAADVPSYPRFVPLCTDARVWDESVDADGRRHFRAAIDLAYPKLRLSETLTSEVTTDPVALAVRAVSTAAPAKFLDNRWLFHDLGAGGTDVDFYISYELEAGRCSFWSAACSIMRCARSSTPSRPAPGNSTSRWGDDARRSEHEFAGGGGKPGRAATLAS
jgi:coenzyme Q-binding protein COQ10